jgi:hypothetical protein
MRGFVDLDRGMDLFIGRPVHECGGVPIHADGMAIAPCDRKRLAATVHLRGQESLSPIGRLCPV